MFIWLNRIHNHLSPKKDDPSYENSRTSYSIKNEIYEKIAFMYVDSLSMLLRDFSGKRRKENEFPVERSGR